MTNIMDNTGKSKRGGGGGGRGGKPLNVEKTFPGDDDAQTLWKQIYDPLQREMKQLFLKGVPLPKDLSIPQIRGAKPWSGMEEGDKGRNYQHWTLYYQCWCIENAAHTLSSPQSVADLPYILGFASVGEKLRSLGINPAKYSDTSARMRAVIYWYVSNRKDVIRSIQFRGLMLSNYHIGHYLWNFLYSEYAGRYNPPPKGGQTAPAISELEKATQGIEETDTSGIVRQRLGQALFRKLLIERWGGACAVSGLACLDLLRASHAKPWKDCASDEERLDVFNGFLLSAQFDALFDSGLITFEDSGAVEFSSELSTDDRKHLGLDGCYCLRCKPDPMHLPFLEWHRKQVFRQ